MSEEGDIIAIGGIIVIAVLLVLFLISPQTGNIAGYSITMPGIGWLGLAAFAVIALFLFFKHRA
ncbi:MAG TPA: hypothetical protein VIO58_05135 [Candidatus Methanoperedens sp.]